MAENGYVILPGPLTQQSDKQFPCLILQGIVHLLTSRLGDGDRCYRHIYAMRLINTNSEEVIWLHQDTTMFQVKNIASLYKGVTRLSA
jgi:hypothetical protein